VPAAIITGMMASPSSPSVRFTALAAPTITSIAKGMNSQPRLISTSLKNRHASWPRQLRRMQRRRPDARDASAIAKPIEAHLSRHALVGLLVTLA
jgi:molybdopterin biosynthesis enzyme